MKRAARTGVAAACAHGFTVVEAVIALALIGLVVTKLTLVMDDARSAHQGESVAMALEDQVMELVDRISFAIVGSSPEKLTPGLAAPFTAATIQYQVSMGIEDGEPVWSDPEIIGMSEEDGELFWGQNFGEVNERRVVWANTVSQMLEDELLNTVDDNGNGIADELGLSFVLDDRSVTIRLTLERERDGEEPIQVTRETTVTCRN